MAVPNDGRPSSRLEKERAAEAAKTAGDAFRGIGRKVVLAQRWDPAADGDAIRTPLHAFYRELPRKYTGLVRV